MRKMPEISTADHAAFIRAVREQVPELRDSRPGVDGPGVSFVGADGKRLSMSDESDEGAAGGEVFIKPRGAGEYGLHHAHFVEDFVEQYLYLTGTECVDTMEVQNRNSTYGEAVRGSVSVVRDRWGGTWLTGRHDDGDDGTIYAPRALRIGPVPDGFGLEEATGGLHKKDWDSVTDDGPNLHVLAGLLWFEVIMAPEE